VSRSTKRSDAVPVLLLISLCLALTAHRILNVTSSIGMLNTDSEGTTWWIWSRCVGQSQLTRASQVAFPNGFDLSRLPVFNLVDELRIQFAQLFDCSISSIIIQLAIFPTICLVGNSLAGYALGRTLFHNRESAFLLGLTCAFSSQIILATRTPLANNVIFPGLLAVLFATKWLVYRNNQSLVLLVLLQSLQTLMNVYNGFALLILTLAILFAHPSKLGKPFLTRLKGIAAAVVSSVVGLTPLILGQMYLFTQPKLKDIYRPVQISGEILPMSALVSKDRGIYRLLSPSTWPRPEAGWLSTPLILALVVLLILFWFRKDRQKEIVIFIRRLLIVATGLVLLIWDVPFFDFLRSFYYDIFFALRGVSNFAKIIPILISIVCLILLQPYLRINKEPNLRTKLFIGIFTVLFLIDNVPISSSYWHLQDIRPLIQSYGSPDVRRSSGPIAQFPDFMYGPKWGLPQRFIQLAQIGDKRPRLNGRDFQQLTDGSAAMPLPIDDASLGQLVKRGATTVMLHRALIPVADLEKSLNYLRSRKFEEHRFTLAEHNNPIYQSLDVIVFELR
jgi:hypothetical protein